MTPWYPSISDLCPNVIPWMSCFHSLPIQRGHGETSCHEMSRWLLSMSDLWVGTIHRWLSWADVACMHRARMVHKVSMIIFTPLALNNSSDASDVRLHQKTWMIQLPGFVHMKEQNTSYNVLIPVLCGMIMEFRMTWSYVPWLCHQLFYPLLKFVCIAVHFQLP